MYMCSQRIANANARVFTDIINITFSFFPVRLSRRAVRVRCAHVHIKPNALSMESQRESLFCSYDDGDANGNSKRKNQNNK